jgi:hypothetical protein
VWFLLCGRGAFSRCLVVHGSRTDTDEGQVKVDVTSARCAFSSRDRPAALFIDCTCLLLAFVIMKIRGSFLSAIISKAREKENKKTRVGWGDKMV